MGVSSNPISTTAFCISCDNCKSSNLCFSISFFPFVFLFSGCIGISYNSFIIYHYPKKIKMYFKYNNTIVLRIENLIMAVFLHFFHTSLTRKSPEEMVDEVLTNIFKQGGKL